jgi:hypothetical protein
VQRLKYGKSRSQGCISQTAAPGSAKGESTEVVWAELSILSQAILLLIKKVHSTHATTSRVENWARVSSLAKVCQWLLNLLIARTDSKILGNIEMITI